MIRLSFFGTASAVANAGGDIMSTIGSSPITNFFSSNTFNENSGRGAYLYNNVAAESYTESAMTGNMASSVSGSISNFFEDNVLTGNLNGGIYIDYNQVYVNQYSLYATGTIANFNVTSTFIGNDITGNEANGGIYIRDYLYAYGTTGNIDGTVNVSQNYTDNVISGNTGDGIYTLVQNGYTTSDNSASGISMRSNQVNNNTQNGLNLNAVFGGTYNADLGTSTSAGNNYLYDNGDGITYYDVVNNTGSVVNAISNWWGADADPAGQISNVSGTTNYSPWLTAAP